MMPFSDSRFPGDGKAKQFQLILRRRPDGKQPEIDPDAREELSQIIAYLENLRAQAGGPAPQEPAPREPAKEPVQNGTAQPPEPPLRLTLPDERGVVARRFKMARVRLGSRFAETPPLSEEQILENLALLTDSKLPADDATAHEPEPGEPTAPPAQKPLPTAAPGRRPGWLLTLAGVALLAAGGSAVSFWMRPAPRPPEDRPAASAPTAEGTVSDEAVGTANRVLQSIQLGKLEEASGQLAEAQKKGLVLPGLRYQAALVALRQGDLNASTDWMSKSLAARECVPECLYLRANSSATGGDYAAVCESFEEAARHAAFSPRYFFFWGEALRRYGHPAQALEQFTRALLCRPNTTDTELIRFKMGLAQIEAGANDKFETWLRSALDQKTVSGDTLLLAAAVEINRAAYPAAAEYLQRAKGAMPPALLSARLRDFFFRTQARQTDLAAAWPATTPAGPAEAATPGRARIVIDPSTRSLAEADPAVW